MEDRQWATSAELAAEYGISREKMEYLLREVGLRQKSDDGSTTYDAGEVARLLDERDERLMSAAVEALDFVEDVGLATEVLHTAFTEMRLAWLQGCADGDVIDLLRRQLVSYLPKFIDVQRARTGTGGPTELDVMRRFERILVDALHERRQPPSSDQAKEGATS